MICISIAEQNVETILSVANSAEMVEIRIDLCHLTEETTAQVFSQLHVPAIATCRPQYCDDATRAILLKTAISSGAQYVDVEIESDSWFKNVILAFAKEHSCTSIISYHNYENTPSREELHAIVNECFVQGAALAKVATTAHSMNDSARVLSLYDEFSNIVALAMGKQGKITRVANLYLGSPFSFAAIDSEHVTADGQFTKEQMQKIVGLL